MGNKHSGLGNTASIHLLEKKAGKIALSGRYHRAPQRVEDAYELTETILGTGFTGDVVMAKGKGQASGSKSQKFAVKMFKVNNVSAKQKQQLQSEVEVFLCMDHPHITRLYDVYDSEDFLILVMECMAGGELFDRVMELKRFSERDAADAVWQMLLALNYLHSHGIVHRDLKLENFLYDKKGSSHVKLIDFGFSHMWDPNIKMKASCGTLSYVAPEVLRKSYTSQCDLWSLGVIVFILLAGYMPFSGSETDQTRRIMEGRYTMKPERWGTISKNATDFTKSLLEVDPERRLTAPSALNHAWIHQRHKAAGEPGVDTSVVQALRQFGKASKFRRVAMEMMAWSLSNEERSQVRQSFIAMDANKHGTITLAELRKVLEDKFQVPDEETRAIFTALDTNNDEEIHYSDFLAAMVSTRIELHDELLRAAFRKFDTDSSGYITVENLRQVLGDTFEGQEVEKLISEADILQDGRVSYQEFVSYLRGDPLEGHGEAAIKVIDTEIRKASTACGSGSNSPSAAVGGSGVLRERRHRASEASVVPPVIVERRNTDETRGGASDGTGSPCERRSGSSGINSGSLTVQRRSHQSCSRIFACYANCCIS